MSFYAVEEIDDALERTKDVLMPFEFSNWTRFAIISIFLGGTGFTQIFSQVPTSTPTGNYESMHHMTGMATSMPPASTAALAGIAAIISTFLLGYLYFSSVFKFVMFRSIKEKNVGIRKNFKDHYIDGFKYFLFQLVLAIVGLGAALAWLGVFFMSPLVGGLLVLALIPVGIVLSIFSGIVHDFGLQKIIEDEEGFIRSVREAVLELTSDWREFGAYLVFRLIVSGALAIMSFFVVLSVTLLLAVPFIILVFLGGMLAPLLGGIVAGIGFLTWLAAMLYVAVPFKVYIYSYFVELYNEFM